MNILLLGGGGREHAFAWKLKQSPLCDLLYIAPGNAGTRTVGTNVALDPLDFPSIRRFCLTYDVAMLIVGPEEPLVRGIYDFFRADPACAHIAIIGPSERGARLEGSKAFAKTFMASAGIPTAAYREFTLENLSEGLNYVASHPLPIVLKADGLAAGKGVLILNDRSEAQRELRTMLEGKFGDASRRVVVEAFLEGIEFSVFALTDGTNYRLLPVAKDYKRIGEGDTGLNTGGMGAISPPPFVTDELMEKVRTRIIEPTLVGIQRDGIRYEGFIFFGLINCAGNNPYVIEYNCRMGDPETEAVLPRITSDLVPLLAAAAAHTLDTATLTISTDTAASVVLTAGGYPEAYEKGKTISGLPTSAATTDPAALVFHAGTSERDGTTLTNGGRVVVVTALHPDPHTALAHANTAAEGIIYEGKYFRRDIGRDVLG